VPAVNDVSGLAITSGNPLRTTLRSDSGTRSGDGTVTPLPGAGLGVAVDAEISAHASGH
jgi:hypothetical protein